MEDKASEEKKLVLPEAVEKGLKAVGVDKKTVLSHRYDKESKRHRAVCADGYRYEMDESGKVLNPKGKAKVGADGKPEPTAAPMEKSPEKEKEPVGK